MAQVSTVGCWVLAVVRDSSGTMRAPAAPCSGRERREHRPGERGCDLWFFWVRDDVRSRCTISVVLRAGPWLW
jgi:hypothetical protein